MSVLICSDGVSSGSPKEASPHPYSQHLCPHLCREQRALALGLFFQLSSLSLSHIFLSSFLCSLHPRLLMTDREQDLLLPTKAGVAEATEAPQQSLKGEENKSSPELFFSLRLREAGTLEELFPPALMYMVPVGSILPLDWLSRAKSILQCSCLRYGLEEPNVSVFQLATEYITQHSENYHAEPHIGGWLMFCPCFLAFLCGTIEGVFMDAAVPHFQCFLTGNTHGSLCVTSGCKAIVH